MVQLQIISDIHLEFRGNSFKRIVKPIAPILILAGDICAIGNNQDFCTYRAFIKYVSTKFMYIIHVAGNHEYYTCGNNNISLQNTIPGINNELRKYTKQYNNVYFLNNETIRLKVNKSECVFIGSTLWSHVDDAKKKSIQSSMNDYSHIYMPNKLYKTDKTLKPVRKFTIHDMTIMHKMSVNYIKKELKKIKPNEKCILITHHKPVMDKESPNTTLQQAYETDLVDIIIKKPVLLAIHGHTHVHYDKIINGVRIYSNPKGYIHQHTKYESTTVIDV